MPRHEDLVDERLVFWYFLAALIFMVVSMLGGLLMALQLVRINPFSGIELLSPGRWRMIHTNAIAYGFIANAFLGVLALGRAPADAPPDLQPEAPGLKLGLSGRSSGPGNSWSAATAVGLLLGQAQGLEWGETPGLDRPARAGRPAPGGDQLHGADRQGPGAAVRDASGTSWRRSSGRS